MKKIILLSLLIFTALSIVAGSIVVLNRLLYLDTYREDIVAAVEETLNRRVTYKNGDFSLRRGPAFTFTDVTVIEKDGTAPFVSSNHLSFKIALLPLLQKRLVLKEVYLDKPRIRFRRDGTGKFNFSDILEGKKRETPLQIRGIRITNGAATFTDQSISPRGVVTSLENLNLVIDGMIRGKSSDFSVSGTIVEKGGNSSFSASGKAKPTAKGPLLDTHLSMKISAKNIDAAHYWEYYSRYVPFRKILGRVDVDSAYNGKLSDFSSSGAIKLTDLRFDYPGVFHFPLTPKTVRIKYDMELTPKDLIVKRLALNVDGLSVQGNCALRDLYSRDLFISAKATTNPFRLEEFGKYIPYGIIPDDPSKFIENHIKGGTFRLQEGTLEGRVSRIAHMEKGTNYNVLYIRGTVDKGLVSFGAGTPAFNTVRGNLALRGKDFILSGMEGLFGGSPFKLEGRITDYPLDFPSGYPFTMTMTPQPAEVAWLLDPKKNGKLTFAGHSTLHLSGNGYTSNYALNGTWDLTDAAYRHSDIIHKTGGQTNNLSFKGSIGKKEARVTELRYVLNSLSLNAGGAYRFAGNGPLSFSANSNQFQIQDIAPMVPRITKYLPKGKIRAAIHGNYRTVDRGSLKINGNIFLSGLSVKVTENMKPLEGINGNIHFIGDSLQTSMLAARLGNTVVHGSGTFTGYDNPALDFSFSTPALDFSDFGLHGGTETVIARNVRGSAKFKGGNIEIKNLSGQINASSMDIRGTVEDVRNPKLDLSITSPHMELDDVVLLRGLETRKKSGAPPTKVSGRVALHADSGKIKAFSFQNLKAALQFGNGLVRIQPVDLGVLGGTVSLRGTGDFSTAGKPRYNLNFNMHNLSAIQLMRSLKAKREVTGNISMEGDVSLTGNDFNEVKNTATGNVRLNCTDGSLRKFAVLSKIFSILNVSQLLKFQLPDMVSGGMPYNKITGTFALRNGVAETNDLFIDSDAMNISVIGKFDMPREELNLTVGVKPLQTVDKIVSRIPIVGWVLTGKNRSLVTAYFEAKGSWENPQVRAIPVRSLAKGVFNIFKRVFQLPAKLITDTGEVIIGK